MTNLVETSSFDAVYQLETTDQVLGGAGGTANKQAQALTNRTKYLNDQIVALGSGKQNADATLTALAGLVTAADQFIYSTGPDAFALSPVTAFIRGLMASANANSALGTLGAAPLSNPAFTGNVGIGVVASAWGSYSAIDVNTYGALAASSSSTIYFANGYFDGASYRYKATAQASMYVQTNGSHQWYTAPSGSAGGVITFTQGMTLDANNNLGVGVPASAWNAGHAIELGTGTANGAVWSSGNDTEVITNAYYQSGWKYQSAGYPATRFVSSNGYYQWFTAPSGTAGAAITFTQAMSLDAIGNLVVLGTASAATPAQFDNSTKLATTAHVKRQGLSASKITVLTGNTTLTAADAGSVIIGDASTAFTVTLPAANTLDGGAKIEFMNIGTAAMTVTRAGTDQIAASNTAQTSIVLGNGDNLIIESNGSGTWHCSGGSAQLGFAAAFGNSLTTSGYQKLPSGLILQWGTVIQSSSQNVSVTFPISFPSAALMTSACTANNTTASNGASVYSASQTGLNVALNAPYSFTWFAIGK